MLGGIGTLNNLAGAAGNSRVSGPRIYYPDSPPANQAAATDDGDDDGDEDAGTQSQPAATGRANPLSGFFSQDL